MTDDLRMLLAQVAWVAFPFVSSKPRGFSGLGLVRIMRLKAVSWDRARATVRCEALSHPPSYRAPGLFLLLCSLDAPHYFKPGSLAPQEAKVHLTVS